MALPLGGSRGQHRGQARPLRRKTEAYKALLREILESPEHEKLLRAILTDAQSKQFAPVQRTAVQHAYGTIEPNEPDATKELTAAAALQLVQLVENRKNMDRLEELFRTFAEKGSGEILIEG